MNFTFINNKQCGDFPAIPCRLKCERERESNGNCSQQRVRVTKFHLSPTSNAEIIQPYFLVAVVTSEKEDGKTRDKIRIVCALVMWDSLSHYALDTTHR